MARRLRFTVLIVLTLSVAGAAAAARREPEVPAWDGPLARSLATLRWPAGSPLTPRDLRGRLVLVEFWAFGCVNCRRSHPAVRALADRYRGTDVALLAIHTPELPDERDDDRLRRAIARDRVGWPVAQDLDARAWRAFGNRYWPAFHLLDRNGTVRFVHVGELHEGSPGWKQLVLEIERLRETSR